MSRTGEQAFREVQSFARREARGNTQAVLEQFVHERFLARLAKSPFVDRFVLKGGMLLAVLDLRRATRDADVMVRGIAMDANELIAVIREILVIELEDGVTFDSGEITSDEIREGAEYAGLRFGLGAHVGGANVKFKLDVSAGDPVVPVVVLLPTLLDDESIELNGYPIESVVAEKAETIITRGDANTRMRDFADVFLIARRHSIELTTLRAALVDTAAHRGSDLIPVADALLNFVDLHQVDWTRFVEQAQIGELVPADLQEVVDAICRFLDPVLAGSSAEATWDPDSESWLGRPT
jgi:hypothetical protein